MNRQRCCCCCSADLDSTKVPPVRQTSRLDAFVSLPGLAVATRDLERDMERTLPLAGGRILCLRCKARSSRTGLQCRRPALKSSRTQKCQFHGGRGSGPKTAEGRARIARAHLVHGMDTKSMRESRSAASSQVSQLEDAMYLLRMTNAPRSRGRKAKGYVPVRTIEDVHRLVLEDRFHMNNGSVRGGDNF